MQPDDADGKDTYLYEWKSTWNYGVSNDIWVDERFSDSTAHGLIRFDLGAIPAGARITGARLELYRVNPSLSGGPIGVYAIGGGWVEGAKSGGIGESSWNQRNPAQAWASAGGDFGSRRYALETVPAGTGWSAWEIGSLVDAWVGGRIPNDGLALLPETAGAAAHFASSDNSDPTLWPKLSVTYACTCGEVCVAPQGSGNILMVVIDSTAPVAEEEKAIDLFESWGYAVALISESESKANFDASIANSDVVFISETVSSNDVGNRLDDAPIGVVSQDGDYNPDLGLATGSALTVGRAIDLVSTDHYITRPFVTGPLEIYAADMEQAIVSGSLTAGQQTLAEAGGVGSLVVLDQGDAMEGGGSAAGRRVILPLGTRYGFNWDYLNSNGRLLVQRALDWGMAKDKISKSNVLMVVVNPASLTVQESAKKALIESWDYTVNLIDESDSQAAFDAAVAANDVVFITEDVTASNINTKLVDATIGVVTEEVNLADEFGFFSAVAWDSGTVIDIKDPPHYITQPFGQGALTVMTVAESLAYLDGDDAPDLLKLAEVTPGVALVALETGAQLQPGIGGNAAGRRVQLPWGGNTFDINHLNDDGRTIMRRAIEWGAATGTPANLPIAHWKLDETTGFIAVDSEGDNDGTLTGGPDWTPGQLQGGLDFDGIDDYVAIGGMDVTGNGITMMAWFNAEAIATDDGRFISKASSPNEADAWWQLSTTDVGADRYLRMRIKAGGSTTTLADSTVNLNTNRWYFAVGTYDNASGEMKLYLDGVEVASRTHAVGGALDTDPAVPAAIGANGTAERFFNGILDDVRIYDYALSAGEIADLAELPPGYLDRFNSRICDPAYDYTGSDGSLDWRPWAWTEINESDGPCAGLIQIAPDPAIADPGSYRLRVDAQGVRMRRTVDLTVLSNPELSFDYRLVDYPLDDFLRIRVSTNGGTDWTQIGRFDGPLDHTEYQSASYDLSPFVAADTVVQFEFNGVSTTRQSYIDNVHIQESVGGPPAVPGYVEMYQPWTAATPDTWETVSLASYGVPANAVVEVAVINEATSAQRWGGVRAVGSSVDRRIQLHEAEAGGIDMVTMHAQADASSQIQHYSDNTGQISFILLGYWTGAGYTDALEPFTANSEAVWVEEGVGDDGVGPNQVAEILILNTNTGAERLAGVRASGTTHQRRFMLQEAESGGVDALSLMVTADASSIIEVYSADTGDIEFYVLGSWNTPPGTYTGTGGSHGQVSAPGSWETVDLSGFGVPADSIAQFVLANENDGAENSMRVREVGSAINNRGLLLHEAEAGGSDLGSLHANVDAVQQVQWSAQLGATGGLFYPVGWWVLSP